MSLAPAEMAPCCCDTVPSRRRAGRAEHHQGGVVEVPDLLKQLHKPGAVVLCGERNGPVEFFVCEATVGSKVAQGLVHKGNRPAVDRRVDISVGFRLPPELLVLARRPWAMLQHIVAANLFVFFLHKSDAGLDFLAQA